MAGIGSCLRQVSTNLSRSGSNIRMTASAESGQPHVLDKAASIARSKAVRRTLLRPDTGCWGTSFGSPISPSLGGGFGKEQSGTGFGKTALFRHGEDGCACPVPLHVPDRAKTGRHGADLAFFPMGRFRKHRNSGLRLYRRRSSPMESISGAVSAQWAARIRPLPPASCPECR